MTKVCAACKEALPEEAFSKASANKDGLQFRCRSCFAKYHRKHYQEKKEDYDEVMRVYRENNPDKVLSTRLSGYAKKPTRGGCYRVVDAARKAGVLVKPDSCQGCGNHAGEPYMIEAHHHDYTKPLDVIWLCVSCHRGLHAAIRRHASLEESPC